MEPAHQGFDRHHGAGIETNLRLIVDHQLAALDGLAQLGLEDQTLEGGGVHIGRVELVAAARMLLRPVQGGIGVADQRLGVVAVVRVEGNPESGAEMELLVFELQRRQERIQDLLGDLGAALGAVDAGQQQKEVVPSEPSDGVAAAHRRHQPLADRAQNLIAAGEAERVVDQLEAVEIEDHHGQLPSISTCPLDRLVQPVIEQTAIRQPGQGIVVGEVANRLFGALCGS